jgi:hypothetical protein
MEILKAKEWVLYNGKRYLRMSSNGGSDVIWGVDAIGYYTSLSSAEKDELEAAYSRITTKGDTAESEIVVCGCHCHVEARTGMKCRCIKDCVHCQK